MFVVNMLYKNAILIICLLLILNNSYVSFSNNEIFKMDSIYIMISALGEVHDQNDDQITYPITKICKLVPSEKNMKAKFISVKEIEALQTQNIEIYYDYNLAVIATSINETWSDYLNVYFINLNQPWKEKNPYKQRDVYEILYPAVISGEDQLISYKYGKTPIIKSINPDTLEETNLRPTQITKFPERRAKFKIVTDGKLKYEKWGMENYYYSYVLPKDIYKDQLTSILIEETKEYVIFELDENKIAILNKAKEIWSTYSINSDRADYTVINNIIVVHCLKKSNEPHKPDRYTGEWALIDAENRALHNINFSDRKSVV